MSSSERLTKEKNRIGIKWKMFAILMIFIVCTLVSIWIVQIRMVNLFYQNAKFHELEDSANAIADALDDVAEAKIKAAYYADNYALDIWVLDVSGEKAEWVIRDDGAQGVILPFINHKMETLYSYTKKNGGIYMATLPSDGFVGGSDIKVIKDNFGKGDGYPEVSKYNDTMGALYVRIQQVSGSEYMIVQHVNLASFQTTALILKYQFVLIGIITAIFALALAWLMSKFITKPIVKMNEAAKKLATGNYDANFDGEGYREINELADTLNYASRELAKTDNLQKELISNISHDLRTPLTMIKGYSEVMRDIPEENTPENVQVIIDETARLSELVNDMLDLSKIQSGTRKPQLEEFSITETLNDTMKRYEKLTMQDGYRITVEIDGDATVIADRGMILQVIYNLINNAINYTGEDKYVEVRQMLTDRAVRISVKDTGDGIAPEDMANIWERYYRVDKVHKRATIGTGLGLSIVKGILEAHDARFGVESAVGEGATFWFELDKAPVPDVFDAEYDTTDDGET